MRENCAVVRAVVILACCVLGGATLAQAEHIRPYRAHLSLSGLEKALRHPRSSADRDSIPTVRLSGRVFSAGNISVRFSERRNKTWRSVVTRKGKEVNDPIVPTLMRGAIALGGGLSTRSKRVMPSAGYMIGNTLKVSFAGRAKGSRRSRQRVYTITMKVDGSIVIEAKVSSIPRSAVRRGACAASTERRAQAAQAFGAGEIVTPIGDEESPQPTESARVVTLSTDADPEWYARYGEASNAVIAGLINSGEAIYARQLGIRFRIVKQHVYADASPYTNTDPIRLLNSFALNQDNPENLSDEPRNFHQAVDLKHLFSGKDMDGTVIGIAYIGVLCSSPALTYGVTSHYADAADFAIFAHELGHNFGAGHDATNRGTLMYPSISLPPADSFSNDSLKEVNEHLAQYGTCMSVEQVVPRPDATPGVPTPIPPQAPDINTATIKITKTRVGDPRSPVVRVTGRVISAAGVAMPSVGVRLFAAGEKVDDVVTDSAGNFKFFLRVAIPKEQQIYIWAESVGGEVYSNFLWLGKTDPR